MGASRETGCSLYFFVRLEWAVHGRLHDGLIVYFRHRKLLLPEPGYRDSRDYLDYCIGLDANDSHTSPFFVNVAWWLNHAGPRGFHSLPLSMSFCGYFRLCVKTAPLTISLEYNM